MQKVTIITDGIPVTINAPENESIRIAGSYTDAVGSIPSMQFTIYKDNPGFEQIYGRRTRIIVYDGDRITFYGRVLSIEPNLTQAGEIYKTVTCEGWQGFLHDAVTGFETINVIDDELQEEMIYLCTCYNQTKAAEYNRTFFSFEWRQDIWGVKVGKRVTEGQDYYEFINGRISELGLEIEPVSFAEEESGYIRVTFGFAKQAGAVKDGKIVLGNNLISYSETQDTSNLVTCVFPFGAKIYTDEEVPDRVTIESINNGNAGLDIESEYGTIQKTVVFEEITDPEELKAKGESYLAENSKPTREVKIAAIDPRLLGESTEAIRCGSFYEVNIPLLNISEYFRITKATRYIEDESKNTYEFSDTKPYAVAWLSSVLEENAKKYDAKISEANEQTVLKNGTRSMEYITVGTRNGDPGKNSASFGENNTASGENSVAAASYASATEKNAIAIGYSTRAKAANAVAIGADAECTELNSVAIGAGSTAKASGRNAIVIGFGWAMGGNSTAMHGGIAESDYAIAIGGHVRGNHSLAIMSTYIAGEYTEQYNSTVIGNYSRAIGDGGNSVLLGNNLLSSFGDKTVIGRYNEDGDNILEIGCGSATSGKTYRENALVVTRDKRLFVGGKEYRPGDAVKAEIEEVTTGEPGSEAEVYLNTENGMLSFSFVIPSGEKGETGPQGPPGEKGEGTEVDSEISDASTNPVQNKVICESLQKKADAEWTKLASVSKGQSVTVPSSAKEILIHCTNGASSAAVYATYTFPAGEVYSALFYNGNTYTNLASLKADGTVTANSSIVVFYR